MTALRKTPVALTSDAAPFAIRAERPRTSSRAKRCWMPALATTASMRTCQRLRDGRAPAEGLAFSAVRRGPAGRNRAVVARQRRRRAGAGARPAGGRSVLPRARHRRRADGPRAGGRESARPWRGDPARRRALLCPLRLLGAQDRRTVAARPVRARPPARPRTARRRARRRLGHDRADRQRRHSASARAAAQSLRKLATRAA